ncbi:claudin-1 [Ambystoma mexicanum]|uniref:claudin-1 n=1 Tax=Ambystoma mexicanum TaxID=8296 RepID=UPI0037E7E569
MASAGLQMLGFALAFLGWVGFIVCTALPQWKMSSYAGDTIVTAQAIYEGLWMSCVMQSTGQMQCKTFDSLLVLNSTLQATRALMISAIVVGLIAIFIAAMGMKCIKSFEDEKEKKAKVAIAGGVVFLIAGLAVLIATSWYGSVIARDFYNVFTPTNTKYEFGYALFIGWASAVLALLGGGLLCCSCPRRETSYPPTRSYPNAASSGGKDYV